jgi:hypothetical protein
MIGHLTIRRRHRHRVDGHDDQPWSESINFLAGDRRREEPRGWWGYRLRPQGRNIRRPSPRTAIITRCDLKQKFLLNLEDCEYTAAPLQIVPDLARRIAEAVATGQRS